MSSQSSFVTVPSATRFSPAPLGYLLQHIGARYEATPNSASDGQTQGIRIEADGTQHTTDPSLATLISGIDFSTETTLNSLLTAFTTEDFATQTTLNALLTAFNAEDFASEATLLSLLTAFSLEDFATQTTLNALLTAFNAEDFASDTTLNALLTAFNTEDFASEITLNALLTAFNAEDFATQTTLAALLTAFNAEDFATQTTLNALLTAFNAEDFASETTLAALLAAQDTPPAIGIKQAAITVGVVAVRCTTNGAAPGADRRRLQFMPDPDSAANFWYGSSSVLAAGATRGIPVFPGQTVEFLDCAEDYYIISDQAGQTVFIVEEES